MKKFDKVFVILIAILATILVATFSVIAIFSGEKQSEKTAPPSGTVLETQKNETTEPPEEVIVETEEPIISEEPEEVINSPIPLETPVVTPKPTQSETPSNPIVDSNIKYIKDDDSIIYTNYALPREVLFTLQKGQSVYVEDIIVDENGVPEYYRISAELEGDELGYILPGSLVNSKTELMGVVYDDVDYSGFVKNFEYSSNPRMEVKGVYVSASTASIPSRVDELIKLANETDINTFVINVKDDSENMLFYSNAAAKYCPHANDYVYISNIQDFVKKMKDNNIYLIARIVTFKSPKYAVENPLKAIVYKDSEIMYYKDKSYWASPYDRRLWEYNVAVAKEAIEIGFNEIQFDYVRFPDNGPEVEKELDFRNVFEESKTKAVQEFLKYAYGQLSAVNAYVSADLYAWAATAGSDIGIGQQWEALTNVVDYISPMMYPSHYGPGNYGLDVPDANPYQTIFESSSDAVRRNQISMTPATIRPWIQDFTATWVKGHITYGIEEVRAEIQALKDNGINEYMLWNASNVYSKDSTLASNP